MYYSDNNLSILQAVTKSTSNTSTTTSQDLASPPSPVAPMFDPNDPENDNYSYAIISTGEIDLTTIRKEKEKAQKLERFADDEEIDTIQDKVDDVIMTTKSHGTRRFYNLILFVVVTICFLFGAQIVLKDGIGMERLFCALNNIKNYANSIMKLWDWQGYIDRLHWDESKLWIQQEKAVLLGRLLALAKQSQNLVQILVDWVDETIQSMTLFLDRCGFFDVTSWMSSAKSHA